MGTTGRQGFVVSARLGSSRAHPNGDEMELASNEVEKRLDKGVGPLYTEIEHLAEDLTSVERPFPIGPACGHKGGLIVDGAA